MLHFNLKLCLVTEQNQRPLDSYLQFLKLVVSGGVSSVQFRDKTSSISQKYKTAAAIKSLLDSLGIPLIINDHVEIALELGAAGVHLGQSDSQPDEARQLLGPDKWIGLSIEKNADLLRANQLNCIDYVAVSAVFPSQSKKNCKAIWGLEGLKKISTLSKYPVIAIGGINAGNTAEVIAHGACGIAVISALHDSPEPHQAAQELIQKMKQGEDYVSQHP